MELASMGMALARELQRKALSADTPKDAATLAEAFAKVGRAVRQTHALIAKLKRERLRGVQDTERQETQAKRVRRKAELKGPVTRLVWTEAEHERLHDAELLICERIEEEAL